MKYIFFVLGAFFMIGPAAALADEIHYQSVTDIRGNTLEITDKSPGGATVYHCDIDTAECDEAAVGSLFANLPGASSYTHSPEGNVGYQTVQLPLDGVTYTIFIFYDLTGEKAAPIDFTIAKEAIVKSAFSPSEEQFVLVTKSGEVKMRDLTEHKTYTAKSSQTELPFFIVSENGSYFSTYNYVSKTHKILNIKTNTLTEVAGSAGYVAFNQAETEAAFSRTVDGFKNLFTIDLTSKKAEAVLTGDYTVEDYLYADNALFYMTNNASPLTWNLYKVIDDQRILVDRHVSYGDYIKEIDGQLAYLKTTGKTTDVYLHKANGTNAKLEAAPESAAADLERKETTIEGRTAAILTPLGDKVKDAYIWLHGGPQRQTSLNYHPYLSYAVYDELLEDISAAGNVVIKLDYAGSWGYGAKVMDELDGQVGIREMKDVEAAIEYAKDKYNVDNVYVIGNSYGGYMAFQAANVLPDEVDGIVSINGVSNWYSLLSQIPSSIFAPLFGGAPNQSNLQTYLRASVFLNAKDIPDDLPLVTIYGTEDKTVPVAQSTEYAEFMEKEDKNVLLTALPGEEHIIRARASLDRMCGAIEEGLDLSYRICN